MITVPRVEVSFMPVWPLPRPDRLGNFVFVCCTVASCQHGTQMLADVGPDEPGWRYSDVWGGWLCGCCAIRDLLDDHGCDGTYAWACAFLVGLEAMNDDVGVPTAWTWPT